ncbi:MAG TPA: dihydrolipoamide acetyltransferase family protein [Burkholderiales bacterium]|nr:dihydrolipoamide acetyltransferase family protein [Burkholderiales bacterium]
MIEFKLPSLGADMDQGKLLEWKVKTGEAVKRGQVIAVVDTSKAAVDVEVWHDGVIEELITKPGETIPVGTVMARLSGAGEPAVAARAPAPKPSAPSPKPAAAPAPSVPPALRKPASPAARKRAHELDVDIEKVTGTGPHGAVTLEDVEKAVKPAAPAPAPAPAAGADRLAEMRKAIGAAMSRSKREIPHYYLAETIPMHRALERLSRANESRPVTERVLMGALQLKAVALTLRQFPELNGFWRDGAFHPGHGIHVGVAISLRQGGLVAPAIHDVDQRTLEELMRALADLVKRARAGSLRSSEMSDPTITVTNLGEQGVEAVYGVIYPPQVALVGFGRIAERAWAEDGALRAAPVVTATLSGDHRASDGHRGARFLAALREQLQRPEEL